MELSESTNMATALAILDIDDFKKRTLIKSRF